ncbi:MAG: ECF transporter S component [Clostridium sp.]
MNKNSIKILVQTALALAIVTICTMVFTVPIPGTQGYVNLGDTMIFTFAIILGKKRGALIGGLGAALADILLGAVIYAPATLIIKALEGFLCGLIYEKIGESNKVVGTVLGCLVGAFTMAFGYFAYDSILYGVGAAAGYIIFNSIQGGGSILLALPLSNILSKTVKRLEINKVA